MGLGIRPGLSRAYEEETMADYRTPSPLAREAMAYVLAGGRGTRLMELTDRRAKPAVYFGGKSRIIDFIEKPKDPPGMPDRPDTALASMGIYVLETRFLMEQLRRDAATEGSNRDFGKDIIPYIVKNGTAWAHRFTRSCVRSSNENVAYWRDVGTVDAYWRANIDLTDVTPQLDLYDRDWPIWTYAEITPPAKFVHDYDGRRGTAV